MFLLLKTNAVSFFSPFFCKVQDVESLDQGSDRYNALQQEKLTLDGRVIQLESMIRQKDEVIALVK